MNYLLILLFSLLHTSLFAAHHVIIDPGHGGTDHGTTFQSIFEANIALAVSKKLKYLIDQDQAVRSTLTRSVNLDMGLPHRAKLALRNKGNLFISIHVNSSISKRAKGAEFYFQNQLSAFDESLFLANRENSTYTRPTYLSWPLKPIKLKTNNKEVKSIIKDLQRNYKIKQSSLLAISLFKNWKGIKRKKRLSIKQAPFFVTKNVNMPSVLVEIGYLSNASERFLLQSSAYQNKIARSILDGIKSYYNTTDNGI